MRRVLAAAALLVLTGCAPRGALVPVRGEPVVRVGIVVDQAMGDISATGQFRVVGQDGDILGVVDPGVVWHVQPADGARLTLVRPDRTEPMTVQQPVTVTLENAGDLVVIGGRHYRGDAVLLRGSTGVTIVNRVPLEAYTQSVTAVELGVSDPQARDAVRAQAVASRTYALHFRGHREALGFDLYATVADQVYPGVDGEKPYVNQATRETQGQAVTWRGAPIEALFHSACGYSTEAADQVFRNGEAAPYLRAVSDRFGRGDHDFYCSAAPNFRWREEWDGATLNAILARTLPAALGAATSNVGRVTDLKVTRTMPSGRVAELVVTTSTGDLTVPSYHVRDVLRPAPDRYLLSNLFQLYVQRQGGELVKVVAAGAGSGHGVGMCQWGAIGRARAGQDYQRILATYYPGTRLERLY
ncbi:MAG: SpoIID/LytB domain-containing protein [Gemmatimonadales bacterium]